MQEDILQPRQLTIPVLTTGSRNVLLADPGTVVWDTTLGSMCVSTAKAAGSWKCFVNGA